MILLNPQALHRFQPDPAVEVAYLLRVPTVIDRPHYRHAVRRAGGKQWAELQMIAALADGVRAIMTEPEDQEQRTDLLERINDYRDRLTAFVNEVRSGEISAEDDPVAFMQRVTEEMSAPPILRELERVIVDHYPPYAAMVADREVYHQIAGVVAARMFLRGWEGIEGEVRAIRGEVPDVILNQISTLHLAQIGAEVERLLEPGQDRLKNSRSPSGGATGPTALNGTETPHGSDPSSMTAGDASSLALMN